MCAVQAVLDPGCGVVALLQIALRLVPGIVALGVAADQQHEYGENGHDRDEHFEGRGADHRVEKRSPDGRIAGGLVDGSAQYHVIDDDLRWPWNDHHRHRDGEEHERYLGEETHREMAHEEHPPSRHLQGLAEGEIRMRVDEAGAPVERGLAPAQLGPGRSGTRCGFRHEVPIPAARERCDSASTNAR